MLFLDLLQQPRGVLDLALNDFAALGRLFPAFQHPARDGDDLIEIVFQRRFR